MAHLTKTPASLQWIYLWPVDGSVFLWLWLSSDLLSKSAPPSCFHSLCPEWTSVWSWSTWDCSWSCLCLFSASPNPVPQAKELWNSPGRESQRDSCYSPYEESLMSLDIADRMVVMGMRANSMTARAGKKSSKNTSHCSPTLATV